MALKAGMAYIFAAVYLGLVVAAAVASAARRVSWVPMIVVLTVTAAIWMVPIAVLGTSMGLVGTETFAPIMTRAGAGKPLDVVVACLFGALFCLLGVFTAWPVVAEGTRTPRAARRHSAAWLAVFVVALAYGAVMVGKNPYYKEAPKRFVLQHSLDFDTGRAAMHVAVTDAVTEEQMLGKIEGARSGLDFRWGAADREVWMSVSPMTRLLRGVELPLHRIENSSHDLLAGKLWSVHEHYSAKRGIRRLEIRGESPRAARTIVALNRSAVRWSLSGEHDHTPPSWSPLIGGTVIIHTQEEQGAPVGETDAPNWGFWLDLEGPGAVAFDVITVRYSELNHGGSKALMRRAMDLFGEKEWASVYMMNAAMASWVI